MTPHYLDACVAVKLVTQEAGHDELLKFRKDNHSSLFLITEFAFYETLSALKGKWSRRDKEKLLPDQKLSDHAYEAACSVLFANVDEGLLQIDNEFDLSNRQLFYDLSDWVKSYNIDYSDALQIFTVLNGRYRKSLAAVAAPVLVTADERLAKACASLNLRAWWFPSGKHPLPNFQ